MSKSNVLAMDGTVTENLSNSNFKVELDNGVSLICHLGGKIRMNYIRIMVGDTVKVEMSPYDLSKGRIVYRYKK